jgi:hypothetical protein
MAWLVNPTSFSLRQVAGNGPEGQCMMLLLVLYISHANGPEVTRPNLATATTVRDIHDCEEKNTIFKPKL